MSDNNVNYLTLKVTCHEWSVSQVPISIQFQCINKNMTEVYMTTTTTTSVTNLGVIWPDLHNFLL